MAYEVAKKKMNDYELYHFGILGQKWGIRRYQNPDGTLTEEGRRRYGGDVTKAKKSFVKKQIDSYNVNDHPNSRTKQVNDRRNAEIEEDQRVKDFRRYDDYLVQTYKDLQKQHPGAQMVIDKDTAAQYNALQSLASTAQREITNKYKDQMVLAFLQDLGYQATQAGVEYVRSILD